MVYIIVFVFRGGEKSNSKKKDGKRKRDESDDETPASLVLTEKNFGQESTT